jgi:LuxR family maltose regulon positive regulatory protein
VPAPVCGDDRHLLGYFTAEVLPAITPEQRDLLVRAAPLERLSGSLCDAALQVTGSADVLAALDRADLFLVALDAEHEWYRCHRLFRDPRPGRRPGCATCCSARRRGSNGTTGSTTRSVTCSELMKRPPRRPLLQSAEAWFFERGAAAGYLMLGELLPMPRSNRSWRSCSLTPRPPAGTSTGFRTGWTSVTHGLAPAPSCGTGGTPAPPR